MITVPQRLLRWFTGRKRRVSQLANFSVPKGLQKSVLPKIPRRIPAREIFARDPEVKSRIRASITQTGSKDALNQRSKLLGEEYRMLPADRRVFFEAQAKSEYDEAMLRYRGDVNPESVLQYVCTHLTVQTESLQVYSRVQSMQATIPRILAEWAAYLPGFTFHVRIGGALDPEKDCIYAEECVL